MGAEAGIVSVVVGTAGHIDHGKSTLVEKLTGVHPDRLKEEQDRGLTIDLGFAPLDLPDGRRVGIIDVPGHERFVKNMVAGATGVDVVLFVVAADDGVMPQTREHLEILGLLGLERGIVVLTKIDAAGVDPELLEVVELELRELLAGTFLAEAPIVRVSSITGEGIDALKRKIQEVVSSAPPRPDEGAFRMPVQRVFSAQGFGTILTGVPLTGALVPGDRVEVLTSAGEKLEGKVRGLQAYGRKVDRVRAGHSSALNIADVPREKVTRGDVVATPGIFEAEAMWEVTFRYLASEQRPLRSRETVRFHVGTAEALGELVILDRDQLLPGEEAPAQLRLQQPVVCAAGDRFILRRHSPMDTLGGGVVLGASKWRLKPKKGFVLERVAGRASALTDPREALLLELRQAKGPTRADDLVKALQRPRAEVELLIESVVADGRAVEASGGKGAPAWVAKETWDAGVQAVLDRLGAWHDAHPFREATSKTGLRAEAGLPDALFQSVVDRLLADGRLAARPGGLGLADRQAQFSPEANALAADVLRRFDEAAYQPPTPAQALEASGTPLDPPQAHDVVLHLVDRGDLVDIGDDIVFHRARYDAAKQLFRDAVKKGGPVAAGAFKDLLGSSRRYAIPLLEHWDVVGFTRREGDLRALREQ